jgi:hypothetical protein
VPKSPTKSPTKSSSIGTTTCDPTQLNQVFKWILAGATKRDIAEAITQSWPDAQPSPLILAAVEEIRAGGRLDAQVVRGFCAEATRDLYRRMVEIGDFAGALRAVKQLADMAGADP